MPEHGDARLNRIRHAAVLIGGAGRRMGCPKQSVELGGVSLLRRALDTLARSGLRASIAGDGPLPHDVPRSVVRITDARGVRGPLAGIIAAIEAWGAPVLVMGVDQPLVTPDALHWCRAKYEEGVAALMAEIEGRIQPLPGIYGPACLSSARDLGTASAGPAALRHEPTVLVVTPPPRHRAAWRSVNTPQELEAAQRQFDEAGSRDR